MNIRESNMVDRNKRALYIGQIQYKNGSIWTYRCQNWMQFINSHSSFLFRVKWKEEPKEELKEQPKIISFTAQDDDDYDDMTPTRRTKSRSSRNRSNRMYIPNTNYYSDYAFTESDY